MTYLNGPKAVRDHTEPHQRDTITIRSGIRGNPRKTIVSEGGLYALILASKLPEARRIKVWVTDEVLPAIRKDGSYVEGDDGPSVSGD